jgi:hypothetical protein
MPLNFRLAFQLVLSYQLPSSSYSYYQLLATTNYSSSCGYCARAEESNTYQLPSNGAAAIATCTSLENACCLHSFEDADVVQGRDELRIMVQIG